MNKNVSEITKQLSADMIGRAIMPAAEHRITIHPDCD